MAQLSIFPGVFDEQAAAAVLGRPAYAVRALLDVLLGYSLVAASHGGRYAGCSRQSGGGGDACGDSDRSAVPGCYSMQVRHRVFVCEALGTGGRGVI